MVRALAIGSTSYDHQSLSDILIDLNDWIEALHQTKDMFQKTLDSLSGQPYWEESNSDFKILSHYALKFFDTSEGEITEIAQEINNEVFSHHVSRLKKLGLTAEKLWSQYGEVWNNYVHRDYQNADFQKLELLYTEGRDMAGDMFDIAKSSARLREFVG